MTTLEQMTGGREKVTEAGSESLAKFGKNNGFFALLARGDIGPFCNCNIAIISILVSFLTCNLKKPSKIPPEKNAKKHVDLETYVHFLGNSIRVHAVKTYGD